MIIVTGANGFIGSAMVRELNDRGHEDILAVDIVPKEDRPDLLGKAKVAGFMLTDRLLNWLADPKNARSVTSMFHMGAISTTTETSWERLQQNNILLSQQLFEIARDNKFKFIYASSGAVYGDGKAGFDDSTPPERFQPLNLYGKSKLQFDQWLLDQAVRPPVCVGLRFFNVYGPNEYHKNEMASVVYKAFLQIKASGSLKLFRSHNPDYKDGMQLRDFVYVKDITRWMYEISKTTAFPSGIYNLGFGHARTWLDLARSVFSNMGAQEKIEWIDIPANIRNQYQYFTEAKMDRVHSAGLSRPEYSLERGVEDYVKKYLLTKDPYL